mmetsp:Transcript_17427/g.70031  ORF Transcript_17427/g.70031 Transcript_17427/m.70031 type:complete len:228 (-) Transcript_17427:1007-1690(-)
MRDDLEELHLRHGREVVHAEHAGGIRRDPLGDVSDRDGRGIRSEDALRAHELLDLAEHFVLELKLLEDGFDDHVDVAAEPALVPLAQRFVVVIRRDPRQRRVLLELRQPLPRDFLLEVPRDIRFALEDALQVAILEHDGHALLGRHLRDARAHQARADHTHRRRRLLLFRRDALCRNVGILLGRGDAVEESDERRRHGGLGEFDEGARLVLESRRRGLRRHAKLDAL